MWTGRQIAILWSVALLLLLAAWGIAYLTDILPSTTEAFVILWVLATSSPAVATWQWTKSGRGALEDTVADS